jgi:hypothetical protein
MTTILNFIRTPSDTRDTASSTISAELIDGKVSAKSLAQQIESTPGAWHDAVSNGILKPSSDLPSGGRVVPGHGTTIIYGTGKRVTVHE